MTPFPMSTPFQHTIIPQWVRSGMLLLFLGIGAAVVSGFAEEPPPSIPRHLFSLLKEPIVFKPLMDWGTHIAVSTPTVNGSKCLRIQYDLSRGERVECFAPVTVNLARCDRVRLVFQGEGSANTLDIRVTDADGSTVGYTWPDRTKSPPWTASEIPLDEMTHFGGGDGFMDWTRVTTIQFTISKSNGGRGQITLQEIKFF